MQELSLHEIILAKEFQFRVVNRKNSLIGSSLLFHVH